MRITSIPPDCRDPDLLDPYQRGRDACVSNSSLLWQIAYAEIYVTETLWPDFGRTELYAALVDFQKRERRYGGLSGGARREMPAARAE